MEIFGIIDVNGWILLAIFLVLTAYLRAKWTVYSWKRLGLPGPEAKLFIGNMMETMEGIYKSDPKLIKKYGRTVGLCFGGFRCVLIADPNDIRDVLVKEFSKNPNPSGFFRSKRTIQRHALNNLMNEEWKFMRNTLTPTFSSGKMRKMESLLCQKCDSLMKVLKKPAEEKKAVDFTKVFGAYTMDAIASLGFGLDIDSQQNPDNEFVKNAKPFFDVFDSLWLPLLVCFPSLNETLKFIGCHPFHMWKQIEFFKSVVKRAIGMRDETDTKRTDLLQLMLNAHSDADSEDIPKDNHHRRGLTEDEVLANSILFMVGGYETTATAISFIAFCLATNPTCQEKLIEEVDRVIGKGTPSYDSLQKMEYLDCVFNETLRLYPPAQRVGRQVDTEVEIGGYKIPKGIEIHIAINALHKDEAYWEEPDKFDPERFKPENKAKRNPYCYLPFGLGPRQCIAMRLAQMEAKFAIVYILQQYKFVVCEETQIPMELSRGGLLKPVIHVQLKIEQRIKNERAKWTVYSWKRLRLPGPEPVLFLGTSMEFAEGFVKSDPKLIKKYGPIVGMYFGGSRNVLLADPDHIKDFLIKDFSKNPNPSKLLRPRTVLRHSLNNLDNEEWKFMRSTLTPTFSSGKMRKMENILCQKCDSLVRVLKKPAKEGRAVDFTKVFGAFTIDAISSLGFGLDIDAQQNPDNEFVKNAKPFFDIFKSNILLPLFAYFPFLNETLKRLGCHPFNLQKHVDFFKTVVQKAIDMRGEADKKRTDLLQLMLNAHKDNDSADGSMGNHHRRGLTEDEILANAILFMAGGYETTATSLGFIAYNLATNPTCQDRLIEEIDRVLGKDPPSYDSLQSMEYLECVFSETLRLYPPALRIARRVETEVEIGGYKIPKGFEIHIPVHALHTDEKYWEEPAKFEPERFRPENKAKRNPYCYLPFGMGPRQCIAMRLAKMETKFAIVHILQRYKFVVCEETQVPMELTTNALLMPTKHMQLKTEERFENK